MTQPPPSDANTITMADIEELARQTGMTVPEAMNHMDAVIEACRVKPPQADTTQRKAGTVKARRAKAKRARRARRKNR